jgi:hypothetical protein
MSEPHGGPEQPDELTGLDQSVRALLGEARVGGPMPVEVADRLERALGASGRPRQRADVVRLRRRVAGGLVAAAIVVVGGGAVVAQLHSPGGSNAAKSSAGADDTTAGGSVSRPEAGVPGNVVPGATPSTGRAPAPLQARARLPQLSAAHFADDVRALLGNAPFATSEKDAPTDGGNQAERADCALPGAAPGANVREVSLDGRLAVLLVDPPEASPRRATAYSCTGGRELASTALGR